MKKQKKKKRHGKSTRDFIGVKAFTQYGIKTEEYEYAFFSVAPTNISVLSYANIDVKIRHLLMVLSTIPNIEISCIDSCECFDDNKNYIRERLSEETNDNVRAVLQQDYDFLDNVQIEMSTARQFMFLIRMKYEKDEQVFNTVNRIDKAISEQGFETRRMGKNEIKQMLGLYFGATMNGETFPDTDGLQYFSREEIDIAKDNV